MTLADSSDPPRWQVEDCGDGSYVVDYVVEYTGPYSVTLSADRSNSDLTLEGECVAGDEEDTAMCLVDASRLKRCDSERSRRENMGPTPDQTTAYCCLCPPPPRRWVAGCTAHIAVVRRDAQGRPVSANSLAALTQYSVQCDGPGKVQAQLVEVRALGSN
eukprot:2643607-Pyramimonas_sp.AAC.3